MSDSDLPDFMVCSTSRLKLKDYVEIILRYILQKFREPPDLTKKTEYGKGTMEYVDWQAQVNFIRYISDVSVASMEMYGTAEEFAEELNIYRQFPEAHRYFQTSDAHPYFNTPIIYKSLNNEKFVCKSDLFVILQNIACHVDPAFETGWFSAMFSIFLKEQQKKLCGNVEFVPYDPDMFEEIKLEMEKSFEDFKKSIEKGITFHLPDLTNVPEICQIWMQQIPRMWNGEELEHIRKVIEDALKRDTPSDQLICLAKLYRTNENLFNTLETIINTRPEMFKLRGETKHTTMPVTVRLFEDGDQKFVMKRELYEAINKPFSPISENVIAAMEWSEIIQFGDRIKNIEFIRTPIIRAKHNSVPIKRRFGGYCELAVDAFFTIMNSLILGSQFFQKCSGDPQKVIQYFNHLSQFFDHKLQHRYFLSADTNFCCSNEINGMLKPSDEFKVNEIAKTAGFTVEDLKNELIHLKLTDLFPRITEHAKVVYEHVNSVKKGRFLRTCDMIDAVEHCQLICVFHQMPDLIVFLHNQKSCGRVLTLKCSTCIPPVKPPKHQDCEECLKNENSLGETKKEMKTNKNRMKKLEKKVKGYNERIEEVKRTNEEKKEHIMKDLEEKENELEELKRNLDEHSSLIGDNEAFQLRIQQLESTNSELKDKILSQEHLKTQAALNEHISQLELDLEAEKEKLQNSRISDDEKSRFELEIQEKTRKIQEFHEKNIKLKAEKEVKERMIQQLITTLASSSSK